MTEIIYRLQRIAYRLGWRVRCVKCGWRHTDDCWDVPCSKCGRIHTGDVACQ